MFNRVLTTCEFVYEDIHDGIIDSTKLKELLRNIRQ